jgi:translation elongation factor EF-Tu-like GTPase
MVPWSTPWRTMRSTGRFGSRSIAVFTIAGRGMVVAGDVERGVVRSGDGVAFWRNDEVAATAEVTVIILDRPSRRCQVGLLLADLRGEPAPGDEVRHSAA